ncbi:MAG: tetratricopeptide repeat protein, partial [Alloprevotella sp.]|nr:tetratricopeptide repeat protein [Alloprevotella sp.]
VESLRKMEEQHRETMENLAHESEALGEENGNGGGTEDPRAAMRQAVRFCVQDLYRYFHLFRFRDDRNNPFKRDLELAEVPALTTAMRRKDSLQAFASYCFAESSWSEALHYFRLMQKNERDATTYEKMGYCCSMEKDYDLAAECFELANMMRPDSPWTLRQLAKMRSLTGDYDLAMEALCELERLQPEDEDTLLRLGECHLQLGDATAALEKLYKADYLKPEGRARRALAWFFLTTGQTEQAANYYRRILDTGNATAEDYYNGGHCAWITGDIPEAVARYVKAVLLRRDGKAGTDFFAEDRNLLSKAGKTDNELLLMRDAINHSIKLN